MIAVATLPIGPGENRMIHSDLSLSFYRSRLAIGSRTICIVQTVTYELTNTHPTLAKYQQ